MGIDTNFYVGVYAKMPEAKQTVKENIYGCSDVKCRNHKRMDKSNKFCPICGAPGATYTKEVTLTKTVSWYDFAKECGLDINDFYQANDTNYLIGNTASYGSSMSSNQENDDLEFTPDDINEMVEEFKTENEGMMKMFKDTYGVDMEVVFGAFLYYS